jgi:hypothetical protein
MYMITFTDLTTTIPDNMDDLRSFTSNYPPLHLSLEQLISTKYAEYSEIDYPPRPPNPFILFRKNMHASPAYKNLTCREMSTIARQEWAVTTNSIRLLFTIISESIGLMHRKCYPEYDYNYTSNCKKQLEEIKNFEKNYMNEFKKTLRQIKKLKKTDNN